MAIIPTVKRRLRDAPAPDQTSPDFEGEFHRAKGQAISQGIRQVGGAIAQVMADERQRADDTAVREAGATLQEESNRRTVEARKRKGKEAFMSGEDKFVPAGDFQGPVPVYENHREEFNKARDKIISGLTPSQRAQFQDQADGIDQQFKYNLLVHESAQQDVIDAAADERAYKAAVDQARITGVGVNAGPGSEKAKEDLKIAIQKAVGHLGEDAVTAAYEEQISLILKEDIMQLINSDQVGAAQDMWDNNDGMLRESERIFITNAMKEKTDLLEADDISKRFIKEHGLYGKKWGADALTAVAEFLPTVDAHKRAEVESLLEKQEDRELAAHSARVTEAFMRWKEAGRVPTKGEEPNLYGSVEGLRARIELGAVDTSPPSYADRGKSLAIISRNILSVTDPVTGEVRPATDEEIDAFDINTLAHLIIPDLYKTWDTYLKGRNADPKDPKARQSSDSTIKSTFNRVLLSAPSPFPLSWGNDEIAEAQNRMLSKAISDTQKKEAVLRRVLTEPEQMKVISDILIPVYLKGTFWKPDVQIPMGEVTDYKFDAHEDTNRYYAVPSDEQAALIRAWLGEMQHYTDEEGKSVEVPDADVYEYFFYTLMDDPNVRGLTIALNEQSGTSALLTELPKEEAAKISFDQIPESIKVDIRKRFSDQGIEDPSEQRILNFYKANYANRPQQ